MRRYRSLPAGFPDWAEILLVVPGFSCVIARLLRRKASPQGRALKTDVYRPCIEVCYWAKMKRRVMPAWVVVMG